LIKFPHNFRACRDIQQIPQNYCGINNFLLYKRKTSSVFGCTLFFLYECTLNLITHSTEVWRWYSRLMTTAITWVKLIWSYYIPLKNFISHPSQWSYNMIAFHYLPPTTPRHTKACAPAHTHAHTHTNTHTQTHTHTHTHTHFDIKADLEIRGHALKAFSFPCHHKEW
jgi:hypothetical protein